MQGAEFHQPSFDPQDLLMLFSISTDGSVAHRVERDVELWEADAIHRANNLAQMATSMARMNVASMAAVQSEKFQDDARRLTEIYQDLGRRNDALGPVKDCAAVVARMATLLLSLFGQGIALEVNATAPEIALTWERRRALGLIVSELVINAMKYAFPDGTPGKVDVTFACSGDEVSLIVADNGVGMNGALGNGSGSTLVSRLTRILGGTARHIESEGGGTAVHIRFAESPL